MVFICPHCEARLRIPEESLGTAGRCNRCGGRIAVVGRIESPGPQMASVAVDAVEDTRSNVRRTPPKAPTRKQVDYLEALGASTTQIEGLDLDSASELIDTLRTQRQEKETPTEKQRACLKRLGATEAEWARVRTRNDAAQLIDTIRLRPTPRQMGYLKDLGASDAQLAEVQTKAAASALIEQLKPKR